MQVACTAGILKSRSFEPGHLVRLMENPKQKCEVSETIIILKVVLSCEDLDQIWKTNVC